MMFGTHTKSLFLWHSLLVCVLFLCLFIGLTGAHQSYGDEGVAEIPAWSTPQEWALEYDFDADGYTEAIVLHNGVITVTRFGELVFTSEDEPWRVDDFVFGDLDADGCQDFALLVWKRGNHGTSHPFWEEQDKEDWLQHIFVYTWQDGGFRQKWLGSEIGVDVEAITLTDDALLVLYERRGVVSTWRWNEWGFELLSVTAEGEFSEEIDEDSTLHDTESVQRVSILIAGDNIAHRGVLSSSYDYDKHTYNFEPVYEHVAEFVSTFDYAGIVQETPLTSHYDLVAGYPNFATPDKMADALVNTGFDAVFCATNHVNDQGQLALEDTLAYWETHYPEIEVLGIHSTPQDAQNIDYVEIKGIKLAFFNYTYGLNGYQLPKGLEYEVDLLDDLDKLLSDVSEATQNADAVVCVLHIGEEYQPEPSSEQKAIVEQLIDAGANIIVCSHSHVVGPYGRVKTPSGNEALVYYSLGNFMSNQTDPACQEGALATFNLEKTVNPDGTTETRISSYDQVPTICTFDNNYNTRVCLKDEYSS
ncbi:MAG: CapA family protein [Coriobacteriales bacterium]|nr:CapA family protein [Coriobacteriales bacterium]